MRNSVLVTGSSRGIGKATAIKLAENGYDIVLHCRHELAAAEETKQLIRELGREVRILQFDIADRARCKKQLETDMDTYGVYYGVVCNAGIARDNAFPALTGEEWDSVIHTNLDGFYNVLNPIIMPMVRARKPGRIVTIASVSGIIGNRGQVNYSAAKAGIIGATKALAIELAKRKITVNCVAPGLIETDMLKDAPIEEAMKMIPARRLGKPQEVASLIAYLFSDEAAYITRQVISVNGGIC
jgi:3-oxoacyl-[acyl-carrier protein] reductase